MKTTTCDKCGADIPRDCGHEWSGENYRYDLCDACHQLGLEKHRLMEAKAYAWKELNIVHFIKGEPMEVLTP
jgi:hypothetical protein